MPSSLNSIVGFNPIPVPRPYTKSTATNVAKFSCPSILFRSTYVSKHRRYSQNLVAGSDRTVTDKDKGSEKAPDATVEASVKSIAAVEQENVASSSLASSPSSDDKPTPKKAPLTARERVRAARVLSRSSESKPAKAGMGRSVLDELRESEKGKKGLPEAPTDMLDDSKRGMPKKGLTFDLPGGLDLFLITLSFVLISTLMFATTFLVWKVGAIHFNEN